MIEIRIHGRGGQGAVVASRLLAYAFFIEGNHVQAFPTYGVERRGAPVAAFVRADARPVLIRNQIYKPDHIVVLDPTLIKAVDVTSGLKEDGWILINTSGEQADFHYLGDFRIAVIDAGKVAVKHKLGSKSHPIVNTAVMGAFARLGFLKLESVVETIRKNMPVMIENNIEAAKEAYESVVFLKNGGRS